MSVTQREVLDFIKIFEHFSISFIVRYKRTVDAVKSDLFYPVEHFFPLTARVQESIINI